MFFIQSSASHCCIHNYMCNSYIIILVYLWLWIYKDTNEACIKFQEQFQGISLSMCSASALLSGCTVNLCSICQSLLLSDRWCCGSTACGSFVTPTDRLKAHFNILYRYVSLPAIYCSLLSFCLLAVQSWTFFSSLWTDCCASLYPLFFILPVHLFNV